MGRMACLHHQQICNIIFLLVTDYEQIRGTILMILQRCIKCNPTLYCSHVWYWWWSIHYNYEWPLPVPHYSCANDRTPLTIRWAKENLLFCWNTLFQETLASLSKIIKLCMSITCLCTSFRFHFANVRWTVSCR